MDWQKYLHSKFTKFYFWAFLIYDIFFDFFKERECNFVGDVPQGKIQSILQKNSLVRYTCDLNQVVVFKKCNEFGLWTYFESNKRCNSISCPLRNSIENTLLLLRNFSSLLALEYKCLNGYEMKDTTETISTCIGNKWSPINLKCYRKYI